MNKSILKIKLFLGVAIFLAPFSSFAKEQKGKGQPLEITADEALEWNRNDHYFKAIKNVHATQGDTVMVSDLLTALYRESKEKNIDIHTIEANGHVEIKTNDSTAKGDKATYDVYKRYAIMTGKNLRLESPDQTVTAHERFEYWVDNGKLIAIGNAKAVREGDTLESDKITALFTEDSKGQRALKSLEANGDVTITTPSEVLTGNQAIYNADTNLAELIGNVKITRGPNVLEGEKAQVDLNTNISKMFGSGKAGGRVRGVFYPGSDGMPGGVLTGDEQPQ